MFTRLIQREKTIGGVLKIALVFLMVATMLAGLPGADSAFASASPLAGLTVRGLNEDQALEALNAQAVPARTYAIACVLATIWNPHAGAGADVCTTTCCQVWSDKSHWLSQKAVHQTGTDEVVTIPDPNLEAAIREAIGKPTGDIYQSDLEGLTTLSSRNKGIISLTGLEYCINLTRLNLWNNQISDLSPLSGLTSLTELGLRGNQISDLSPLSGLTSLTELTLWNNQISDLSPLSGLTSLTELWLWRNQITDLTPLANLINLTGLGLGRNQITDLTPLANLINLTGLWLGKNQITDLTPLANLTSLIGIELFENQIADLTPLANLTNLTSLRIWDNQIADLTPLANLTKLTWLPLRNNQIADLTPLANLTNLAVLGLHGNQISDILPLSGLVNLQRLNLGRNQITDISPLYNLINLTELWLGDNRITDISPIANLTNLTWLWLDNNRITDITPLSGLAKLGQREWWDWEKREGVRICLGLANNQIEDISPLVQNHGLSQTDGIDLRGNPLSQEFHEIYLPQLKARGVEVLYDALVVEPPSGTIDNHTVSPRNITVGESVTIGFTFTNIGDKEHTFGAGATLRRDGDDATRINFLTPVTLAPGESETVQWTHTIDTPGKWEVVFGVWEESTHPLENLIVETGWVDEYIIVILAEPEPHPVITSPLEIIPVKEFYRARDTLTARFTITNRGTEPITFNVLVVGGRGPTGEIVDFDKTYNLTLDPDDSYHYQGSLTLPDIVGRYHFFIVYQTPDGKWHSNIDVKIEGQIVDEIEAARFTTRDIDVFDRTYIRPAPPTATWEQISGPWEEEGRRLSQIAVHPDNPEIIYVVVEQHHFHWGYQGDRLYKSIDGGESWNPINEGLPGLGFWGVTPHRKPIGAIAISPSDPNIIYVGTSNVDPYGGIARTGRGIYKSTDGGWTWAPVGGPYFEGWLIIGKARYSISSLLVHPTNPDIVYAGTIGGGIWRTTNGGESWEQIWALPLNWEMYLEVNALAISPANPDIIYAAAYNVMPLEGKGVPAIIVPNRLIKSEDGGDTWETLRKISPHLTKVDNIAVSSEDANTLYIITGLFDVYKSVDGGKKNWVDASGTTGTNPLPSPLHLGPTLGTQSSIAMHPDSPDVIFAAREWAHSGVYFSPDAGANWFPSELQVWINELVFASDADSLILYAAGPHGLWAIDLAKGQMIVRLDSPGELRVYDSQGRVTGLVDGVVKQEIPHSVYDAENKIVTILSPIDNYYLEVAGIEKGTYALTKFLVIEGQVESFAISDVATTETTTHRFVVDPEVPVQAGVTMKTDADGDGVFEEQRTLHQPVASFAYSPDEMIAGRPITFDASGSSDPDGNIISYEWDFGDGTSGTGKVVEHTFALAGNYTVTVTIADDDGVVTSFSKMVTVMEAAVDLPSAVVVEYDVLPRDVAVGEKVTIGFTFANTGNVAHTFGAGATLRSPDGRYVEFLKGVTVNPGETGNAQWTHTVNMPGRWDVAFRVWEESTRPLQNLIAQTGWVDEYITAIENLPPVAIVEPVIDRILSGDPVVFDAFHSYDPDGEIISYEWDFGDGTSGTGKVVEHTFALAGDYTVTLTIADDDGVVSSVSKLVTVTEAPVDPPSAVVVGYDVLPRDVGVGEEITIGFTFANTGNVAHTFGAGATLRNPDGRYVEFLKPVTVNPGETGNAQWTHAVDVAGRWDVVFRVWEESTRPLQNLIAQTGWVDQYITAIENLSPVAIIEPVTDRILSGDPVVFDASHSYDPDGQIVSYEWNFGDGTSGTGKVFEHTFALAGNYTVTVTITDNDGAVSSVSKLVTVTEAPVDPPDPAVDPPDPAVDPPDPAVDPPADVNWGIIGGIAAAVVVVALGIFFLVKRRRVTVRQD